MPFMLPEPLPRYFDATHAHDVDAMLAVFAEDATVHDEGETHVGRPAIRAWPPRIGSARVHHRPFDAGGPGLPRAIHRGGRVHPRGSGSCGGRSARAAGRD